MSIVTVTVLTTEESTMSTHPFHCTIQCPDSGEPVVVSISRLGREAYQLNAYVDVDDELYSERGPRQATYDWVLAHRAEWRLPSPTVRHAVGRLVEAGVERDDIAHAVWHQF